MNREKPFQEQPINVTLFLAYGWAYAFTAFAALVGMHATRMWPSWATWPAVLGGFAILFLFVMLSRHYLQDLLADLGIREKFGIFIGHALIFMTPKLVAQRATLIDCLIALQLPLVFFLLRRENFVRLYCVNFLIAALSIFVDWQTRGGGFDWAIALAVFLVGCFAADHFFLAIDGHPGVMARPVIRPLWATVKFGSVSLAGGLLLYALTPDLALARRDSPQDTVVYQPGGVKSLSLEAMLELVWDAFVVMILIVVALGILQWLKKKYGRRDGAEDVETGSGVMRIVRKALQSQARPPEIPRGFSPREQVLRGYWAWCDEMERFGVVREPDVTPKEFAARVARFGQPVIAPLCELTRIFEKAKFDRIDPSRDEANRFFTHSRRVVELLLASLKKK